MAEGGHTSDSVSGLQDCKDTCSICLELIREPRFLPCEHRFCASCLIGYIDKCFTSGNSDVIPCPLCRAEIHVSNYTKAKSSEVDDISKLDLLSFSNVTSENESRRVIDDICQPCKRGNENVKATHFCSECSECICSVCVTHHSRNKWTCNHTVTTINVEGKPKQDDVGCDFPTRCELHHKKQFKYICIYHNILCCSKCVIEGGHRACSDVKSLTEFGKSDEYEKLLQKVKNFTCRVIKDCEILKQEQLKCKSNMADIRTCVIKSTDELEKEMMKVLSKGFNMQRAPILETINVFNEKASTAVQQFDEIETRTRYNAMCLNQVEKRNNVSINMAVICEIQRRIDSEEKIVKDITTTLVNSPPNIKIDLEPVTTQLSETLHDVCLRLSSEKCTLVCPWRLRRPIIRKRIHKKETINDMVFLHNGNVVIADKSTSLVMLESSLINITKVEIPSQATSVAEYYHNNVVVSLPATKSLAFVKFSGNGDNVEIMEIEKVVTCLASCDVNDNRMVFVYDQENHEISHQVVQSSLSKEFKTFAFNLPHVYKMCVDDKALMVYVSQPKLNRLLGIDFEGTRKFAFTHQQLHVPFGMHLAQTNKLYVCCYGTQQINELSLSTRRFICVAGSSEGIKGPIILTIDKSLTRCLVYDCDKSKELKLYDL
ncbi:uncharacterized protein LOC132741929 [Ruditapes philippinarum]|uniref:uncharacterized protein LOC132741929 n=1 Tax=Ruditapes philippinarum TaxID=129788 RepID=UPI00295AD6D6|nr:uncharacterized protein LOC132741929 [Ruditapes philippinarum]